MNGFRIAAWVLLAFLPALASSTQQATDGGSFCISPRAREARFSGSYEEALRLARMDLTSCRQRFDVPAWQLVDAENLVAYLEVAVSLPGEGRQDLAEADALQAIHERAADIWDLEGAVRAAEDQLRLRREHLAEPHPEVHTSLRLLASAVRRTRNQERGAALVREALEMSRAVFTSDHPSLADDLDDMAAVLLEESDVENARAVARESLEMRRRLFGEAHTDIAASLLTLSSVERAAQDIRESVRLASDSLSMRRKVVGTEHLDVAESLVGYAAACRETSEWGLAEKALREAVAIRRQLLGDKHVLVAEALSDLADVLRWQKDLVEARELLREVIEIQRPVLGDHPAFAETLERLAMLHRFALEYDESYPLLLEAVAIRRKVLGESHSETLVGRANLALNHALRGKHDDARRIFAEVNDVVAEQPDSGVWIWLREVLDLYQAHAANYAGDYATAIQFIDRWAVKMEGKENFAELVTARFSRANYCMSLGDPECAETSYIRAAEAYEIARKKTAPGIKSALFKMNPYEPLALCRLERGAGQEAWPTVEAARARVLADLVLAGDRPGAAGLGKVPFDLERIQASLDERMAIVGWVDSQMSKEHPRSWAYVIRHEGPVRWVRLASGESLPDLADRLGAFRDALADSFGSLFAGANSSFVETARTLWTERFEPLEVHLDGVEELVLIPSWAMGSFPVAALIDGGGSFLGERFRISYAPSSSFYVWLREASPDRRPGRRTALLVGDPPFRAEHLQPSTLVTSSQQIDQAALRSALRGDERAMGSLPRLHWSRVEIDRIATRFDAPKILLGRAASEGALAALADEGKLEGYRVIHLATHALIDGEKPERSGLVFSQVDLSDAAQPDLNVVVDGIVSGSEILRGWKLDADLVTLSACETALGKSVYGEGVVGLSYPFLKAGARSLLVSLWKVDDQATMLLMEKFYEAWMPRGEGPSRPKVQALREAQQWLRDYQDESGDHPYAHPYYWSAFVLLGDPR